MSDTNDAIFDPSTWRDAGLLRAALTHSSARGRRGGASADYERLEFLGDRVLGLALAEMLYARFEEGGEGELARRIADLGSGASCARVGVSIGLWEQMTLGMSVRRDSAGRSRILADGVEALLGALFLDRGWAPARACVRLWWEPLIVESADVDAQDAKSRLQEWAQARGEAPVYDTRDISGRRSGPPRFRSRVSVPGLVDGAHGVGSSKKEAERLAAEAALAALAALDGADEPQPQPEPVAASRGSAWTESDRADEADVRVGSAGEPR